MQRSEADVTGGSSIHFDSGASSLPATGNDAIEILVNDHRIIKGLLNELTQPDMDAQRTGALERLKRALTIHNATEENLVYPALRVVAGKKSEADHLYHETAEADVVVFQIDTMLKQGQGAEFAAMAEKLRSAVLEHIEDEETKAFPHLKERAEPEQARMLTESVREFRAMLQVQPPHP